MKYAGQAVDFANKSTAHAAEAVKAANTATKAVSDALAVEQNARNAEAERLQQDKLQAIEEAQLLAQIEAEELVEYQGKRTQAQQTAQATKDLIADAEQALYAGNMDAAATLGRKAAIALLDSWGAWTRQAAQYALAGNDNDVHAWIDLDRLLAQSQDDRESALHVATIAGPAVAEAAQAALESSDSKAVGDFLTSGMKRASDEDLRVAISVILSSKPGRAVTVVANKALDENTTESLNRFFDEDYPRAVREDDAVLTSSLLTTGVLTPRRTPRWRWRVRPGCAATSSPWCSTGRRSSTTTPPRMLPRSAEPSRQRRRSRRRRRRTPRSRRRLPLTLVTPPTRRRNGRTKPLPRRKGRRLRCSGPRQRRRRRQVRRRRPGIREQGERGGLDRP